MEKEMKMVIWFDSKYWHMIDSDENMWTKTTSLPNIDFNKLREFLVNNPDKK